MNNTPYDSKFHRKRIGNARYPGLAIATLAAFTRKFRRKPTHVVDVGSSIGVLLQQLQLLCQCKATGIDYSVNPDDIVYDGKYIELDLESGVLNSEDLETPGDIVVCQEVLEHIVNTDNALDAIDAAAAKEALLVFGAARPGQKGRHHVTFKTKDEWRSLLEERGWRHSIAASRVYSRALRNHGVGGCWLRNTMCLVRAEPPKQV